MKEIIPFKKDILFKTKISEITDISLSHDYKIDRNAVEGTFTLEGEYKMTEASAIPEEFMFTIPFSIAISDRIDFNTINLTIDDFNYNYDKDVMNLNINMNMEYEEEVVEEEIINEIDGIMEPTRHEEEEMVNINETDNSIIDFKGDENEVEIEDSEIEVENKEINIKNLTTFEDPEITINNITKNFKTEDDYSTYKVYIVRKDDTVESICSKYNIDLDSLNDYNNLTEINIGDKVIIPYISNEE